MGDLAGQTNLRYYPAVPNTNIGPALNTYLSSLVSACGRAPMTPCHVQLPAGTFYTSVEIKVPSRIRILGAGKRATTIQACNRQCGATKFASNTPLFKAGLDTEHTVFDSGASDLWLDCNFVTGCVAALFVAGQEGTGLEDVGLSNYLDTGIKIDNGTTQGNGANDNLIFRDLELYSSRNVVTNGAINIIPGLAQSGLLFDKVTVVGGNQNTTLCGGGPCTCPYAVKLVAGHVTFHQVHIESCTDGFLLSPTSVGALIGSLEEIDTSQWVTNLIHVTSNGAQGLNIAGLRMGSEHTSYSYADDYLGVYDSSFALARVGTGNFRVVESLLSVGSSPWTYKNTTAMTQYVELVGGSYTMTLQRVGGIARPVSGMRGNVTLAPGDQIVLTGTMPNAAIAWPE